MNRVVKKMHDSDFNSWLTLNWSILYSDFVPTIFLLDAVTKLEAPFDVYKFECTGLIPISEAFKLKDALLTMPFKKKSCDLYSFSQSSDFFRIGNSQKPKEVQQFLEVLKEIKNNVETFLGTDFNKTISVSCSKYDTGDYLLCHDDCVDDRAVAFIYYLNYDWLNEWCGTLDLYSVDEHSNAKNIVLSFKPEFNTMIFFQVGKQTFHQVAENSSNFPRISINGWFHRDEQIWRMFKPSSKLESSLYLPINSDNIENKNCLPKCITPMFHEPKYREAMRKTFNSSGFIMCEGFFNKDVLYHLNNDIFSNKLNWKIKGTLNKKHYKYVDNDNLTHQISFVVGMLKLKPMFEFFKECTGLEFIAVNIEVQKWHGGHYMVSGGHDGLPSQNVLSVYLFFSQCADFIHCQASDDKPENLHYVFEKQDTLIPLFTCKPQDNTIFMVHRTPEMDMHIKYCKKVSGHSWTVIMANYLVKDNFNCIIKCSKSLS